MRASRAVLLLAGLAALAWGVLLALRVLRASTRNGLSAIAWVLGPPIVHDAVIAPLVGAVGLLLAYRLREPWRTPVTAGAVASGVLLIIAVPTLWRTFSPAVNPGLDDRDYAAGLLVGLAVVWAATLLTGLARRRRARRPRSH